MFLLVGSLLLNVYLLYKQNWSTTLLPHIGPFFHILSSRKLRTSYFQTLKILWNKDMISLRYGLLRHKISFDVSTRSTQDKTIVKMVDYSAHLADPCYFLFQHLASSSSSHYDPLEMTSCGMSVIALRSHVLNWMQTWRVNGVEALNVLLDAHGPRAIECSWPATEFPKLKLPPPSKHKITKILQTCNLNTGLFPGHSLIIVKHASNEYQVIQTFVYQYTLMQGRARGFYAIKTRNQIAEWLLNMESLCQHRVWTAETTQLFAAFTAGGDCSYLEGAMISDDLTSFFAQNMTVCCTAAPTSQELERYRMLSCS